MPNTDPERIAEINQEFFLAMDLRREDKPLDFIEDERKRLALEVCAEMAIFGQRAYIATVLEWDKAESNKPNVGPKAFTPIKDNES